MTETSFTENFSQFIKASPKGKLKFIENAEFLKGIESKISTLSDNETQSIVSWLAILCRTGIKILNTAVTGWQPASTLKWLLSIAKSHNSESMRESAFTVYGSLMKHTYKSRDFQNLAREFSLLNISDERKENIKKLLGKVVESKDSKKDDKKPSNEDTTLKPKKREAPSSDASVVGYDRKASKRMSEVASPPIEPKSSPVAADEAIEETTPLSFPSVDQHNQVVRKLSDTTFASMNLCLPLMRAIKEVFRFEFMTPVQAQTVKPITDGVDVLAKAKTGTGKTLGFLLPQMERLYHLNKTPELAAKNQQILSVLVIAPTRELVLQIESEATKLLTFFSTQKGHHFDAVVTSVIGGRSMSSETRKINSNRVDVLVATPGRLLDHLKTDYNFADKVKKTLQCFVLDECDQLMDMGFIRDLKTIASLCPAPEKRSTLLFSATLTPQVETLAAFFQKRNRAFIDCVQDEPATHTSVEQRYIYAPQNLHMPILLSMISDLKSKKAIVFFQTSRGAQIATEILQNSSLSKTHKFFEIHSRKSQAQRVKAQNEFGSTPPETPCVLLSSDASARGVDYPHVAIVIQIGAPVSVEQYIHRLGRTARAGREGEGVLICDPVVDSWFIKSVATPSEISHSKKTTFSHDGTPRVESNDADVIDASTLKVEPYDDMDRFVQSIANRYKNIVDDICQNSVDDTTKAQAYQALLGYFLSSCKKIKGWDAADVVKYGNDYARNIIFFDFQQRENNEWLPPALRVDTARKMNLSKVPGVNIEYKSANRGGNNKYSR